MNADGSQPVACRCTPDEPQPALPRPPFRNDLGTRIQAEVCAACWKKWLHHQTALINHYQLDPRTKEARTFLYEQIEKVLLGDEKGATIDTSKEGSVEW